MTTEQERKLESSTSVSADDQKNADRVAQHEDVERILKPRTPREREYLFGWFVHQAPRIEEVLDVARLDTWRSKATELRGIYFCSACEQILGSSHCPECGLHLPGVLPTRFEVATSCHVESEV